MAEEEKKNLAIPAPAATTTAADMKTQAADANQFKAAFDARKQGYQDNINSTLGTSLNTQKQGLADAFKQNTAAQDQAMATSQNAYGSANADLGVQAARTQRDMDSYADARDLNRQAGSQQALSLGLGASVAAGRLAQQQQMALEESQRQKALLSTDYNNRVQKAISNHDYKQAAALLDNFNNQNTWLDKNAAAMATFGNFTGYEQLYGPGQAQAMQQFWIGSNPELAYNTGVIDAARYKQITGREAPDYVPPPSEGGGGGGNLGERWWGTVQGQMALGNSYSAALSNASGHGGGGGWQPR